MTPSNFRKCTFFSRFLKKDPKRSNRPKYKLSVTAIQEYGQRKDAEGRPHQEDALVRLGDFFYLCTDGMLENMENDQLRYYSSQEISSDEERSELLRRATAGNCDNHTAFIIHNLETTYL